VNIECAGGGIATKTTADENKNQTRQTIYQPAGRKNNKGKKGSLKRRRLSL